MFEIRFVGADGTLNIYAFLASQGDAFDRKIAELAARGINPVVIAR